MTVGMTRWNPTADFFPRRFSRLLDQMWDESVNASGGSENVGSRTWAPPVDIRENEESLTLTAELPGLSREDVSLSIENNVLTLSGERKFEKDVEKENYHRIERTYGAFSRSFSLPNNVSSDSVDASFENGVLTVVLAKADEAKPRKIEIR